MAIRQYITDKDHQVLLFVEKYGSITISQTQKMYYNTQKYGYDIARRRLKKLVDYGKLKVARDPYGNENVYYMDKKLSYHDLLVLSYYAELKSIGAEIKCFKPKIEWLNGNLISDAYCVYEIEDNIYFDIVEVVRTHGVNKEKYYKLYKSNEAQKLNTGLCKDIYNQELTEPIFPRLIVIDNVRHSKKYQIDEAPEIIIHQLDFNFTDFVKILV